MAHLSNAFDVDSQAPGGLHVAAMDVDGDHDLDLIITTEFSRRPVGVWINDGHGVFSKSDSAAWPAFIWHESKNFFEPPARPVERTSVVSFPDGGWTLEDSDVADSLSASVPVFFARTERSAQALINPSSPFRAPPLS